MEMVVVTKVTYKYLMNQSKHDLAQMVLDLLKKKKCKIMILLVSAAFRIMFL